MGMFISFCERILLQTFLHLLPIAVYVCRQRIRIPGIFRSLVAAFHLLVWNIILLPAYIFFVALLTVHMHNRHGNNFPQPPRRLQRLRTQSARVSARPVRVHIGLWGCGRAGAGVSHCAQRAHVVQAQLGGRCAPAGAASREVVL